VSSAWLNLGVAGSPAGDPISLGGESICARSEGSWQGVSLRARWPWPLRPGRTPTSRATRAGCRTVLLSDGAKFTLPVAVVSIQEHTFGAIDYGALEAGVMVMAVPCGALFLALQRHYVQGFTTGALRG
jgi:hypothetical protein